MTSEEKMALDRHSEALEAHTCALNNLTAMLSGIFEESSPFTHETIVHPLHRTLNTFIERVEEMSFAMSRAASVNDEAADKMSRAASINDGAADKMSYAARRY